MPHSEDDEPLILQEQTANRAAWTKARGAVRIYHSCDPPNTKMLKRYTVGYYLPRTGYETSYPEQTVLIPHRFRETERVLRCAVWNCETCESTREDVTDLTLSVAKDHNIYGVQIRPGQQTTVEGRMRDAVTRGRWQHQHVEIDIPDQMMRWAILWDGAWAYQSVVEWLYQTPFNIEHSDSTPLLEGTMLEPTQTTLARYILPHVLQGEMAVGGDFSEFTIVPDRRARGGRARHP